MVYKATCANGHTEIEIAFERYEDIPKGLECLYGGCDASLQFEKVVE